MRAPVGLLHLARPRNVALAVVALAVAASATYGPSLLPAKAQQSPPIPIQVEGTTIWLEPGRNVHPQTYAFLASNPGAGWYASVTWAYIDGMWIPLARGVPAAPGGPTPGALPERPAGGPGLKPNYDPECRWSLSVTPYKQCVSPGYGDDFLFKDAANCGTMCRYGCTIASVAMVFKYFGANTDPGVLNTCMTNPAHDPTWTNCAGTCPSDGKPCCIAFACAADHCSNSKAQFVGMYGYSTSALCALLSLDRPPIVEVLTPNGGRHWVVVYRSAGLDPYSTSDYSIADPLDGSTYKKLSYYSAQYTIVEYRRR